MVLPRWNTIVFLQRDQVIHTCIVCSFGNHVGLTTRLAQRPVGPFVEQFCVLLLLESDTTALHDAVVRLSITLAEAYLTYVNATDILLTTSVTTLTAATPAAIAPTLTARVQHVQPLMIAAYDRQCQILICRFRAQLGICKRMHSMEDADRVLEALVTLLPLVRLTLDTAGVIITTCGNTAALLGLDPVRDEGGWRLTGGVIKKRVPDRVMISTRSGMYKPPSISYTQ